MHLQQCPACTERLEQLAEAVSLLRRAGQEAVPAGFRAALHQRLLAEPPPRRPLSARCAELLERLRLDSAPRLGMLASAAAAAVVLAMVSVDRQRNVPEPAVGEVAAPFQVPSRRIAVVHLDFVSNMEIDNVQFEVTLPQELAFISDGKPVAQRTLQWSGSLSPGSNPVPLAISGSKPGRYRIVARARGDGVEVTHDVLLEVVPS